MPLNLPDFLRAPIQRNQIEINQPTNPFAGLENVIPNAFAAYNAPIEMRNKREMSKHDLEAKRIANALQAQFGAREKEAEIAHKEGLAKYYLEGNSGQGGGGRSGAQSIIGKLFNERDRAAEQYGEDSNQVKAIDSYVNKLSGQGNAPGASGVTSPVRTKQINAMIANEARQYMADNLEMPYIGTNGNAELIRERREYDTTKDPRRKAELRDKLAKFANSVKMAPEYAGYQLAGQGINATKYALHDQEKAIKQGWPESTNLIVNNLPKDVQQEANDLHSQSLRILSNIRERAYDKALRGNVGLEGIFDNGEQGENSQMADEYGYTPEDYEYSASQNNISVEDVKRRIQGAR